MKNPEQKYKEAVARNIASAKRSDKYKGKEFHSVCRALGIRKEDTSYDKQVNEIIGAKKK